MININGSTLHRLEYPDFKEYKRLPRKYKKKYPSKTFHFNNIRCSIKQISRDVNKQILKELFKLC